MKILGLDLSLQSAGYAVLRDENLEAAGVEKRGAQMREVERLLMFDHWIDALLERHNPDVVGIEGYSYNTRSKSTHAFAIGEVGGIIKASIAYAGMQLVIVPPASWKKLLCGHGNLRKELVPLELFKRYAIEFPSQDTLEAWAVAMFVYRQHQGLDKPEPKRRGAHLLPLDAPGIPAERPLTMSEELHG